MLFYQFYCIANTVFRPEMLHHFPHADTAFARRSLESQLTLRVEPRAMVLPPLGHRLVEQLSDRRRPVRLLDLLDLPESLTRSLGSRAATSSSFFLILSSLRSSQYFGDDVWGDPEHSTGLVRISTSSSRERISRRNAWYGSISVPMYSRSRLRATARASASSRITGARPSPSQA